MASVPLIAPHAPAQWRGGTPAFAPAELAVACAQVRHTAVVIRDDRDGRLGVGLDGALTVAGDGSAWPVLGMLPPLYPEWLGDRSFNETHGTRFPYVAGAMANGIATTRLVIDMARAGCLGFFGAAGLSPARVEAAVDELVRELDPRGLPWGVNLIHSPQEPALEDPQTFAEFRTFLIERSEDF